MDILEEVLAKVVEDKVQDSTHSTLVGGARGPGQGEQGLANRIMQGVRRAQLPFKLDTITPGDGNCFSRAVWSQIQRPEIHEDYINYDDIKKRVANFVEKTELPMIRAFKERYETEVQPATRKENGGKEETWDAYWQRMLRNQEWSDSIFIQATAWFLEKDIFIIFSTATPENPFITISGSWEGPDHPCEGAPLLLGYVEGLHYQSLLPIDQQPFRPQGFNPWTPEETMWAPRFRKEQAPAKRTAKKLRYQLKN